jgi:hypothetical protein
MMPFEITNARWFRFVKQLTAKAQGTPRYFPPRSLRLGGLIITASLF